MQEHFRKFARATSAIAGSPWTFVVAVSAILLWAVTGPLFGFSTTWQLLVNTGTTILTFLMVFLIQNTQNRDAQAIHMKLDELLRALKTARNDLVGLEELPDDEFSQLKREFHQLHEKFHPVAGLVQAQNRQVQDLATSVTEHSAD